MLRKDEIIVYGLIMLAIILQPMNLNAEKLQELQNIPDARIERSTKWT